MSRLQCCFKAPQLARVADAIAHYDSTDPAIFAAVIYLCDSRFSGTSFYRHRRTGYEEITAENRRNYQIALATDMRLHGPPKRQYMNGA